MVDLHCHVLFDIDDGPAALSDSLRLCQMAAENGINKIVATPHLTKLTDVQGFLEQRDARLATLKHAVEQHRIPVELYPGAEVYVNDDLFYSDDLRRVTLNGSRYLLVEFDFYDLTADRLLEYLDEIYSRGLVPIIAHPERYEYLQQDYPLVNYLAQKDVLFQINAADLCGEGGREEFELAYQMALNGVAAVIATDAHSLHRRPNDLLRMIQEFPPDLGGGNLDQMLNLAPEAILADRPVPYVYKTMLRRRRRGF